MSEKIKEIPLKERIEKLLESEWVNEFNYLESQLQEARYLVVILQQKVEQLENIRKEAIKYVQEKADYPISYYHCLRELLEILDKGSK